VRARRHLGYPVPSVEQGELFGSNHS
jgi:hypothetical protein